MIGDKLVTVYTRSESLDAERAPVASFALTEVVKANVQPHRLRESEAKASGRSTAVSGALLAVLYGGAGALAIGGQVEVDGARYDVRDVRAWPDHAEAILVPVQGGQA